MSIRTLMVHVRSGRSNGPVLAVAAELARLFGSGVVGVAACQPMMVVSGEGYVCGDVYENDQRHITAELRSAEREFRSALQNPNIALDWRSSITIAPVSAYLAAEARCVDLIVMAGTEVDMLDVEREANPGLLALQAGRPVLIVPSEPKPMNFERALLSWKDTRESRRAAVDALPLLERFARVTVAHVADPDEVGVARRMVADVIAWLASHGITAESYVETSTGDDVGQLRRMIAETSADLVVAGAYGHNRLREWVLGGVTRDVLLGSKHLVLVSH